MVRKILATCLLSLSLSLCTPALSYADDETTTNFNVFDVFSVEQDANDNVDGSTTISDNIKKDADALTGANHGNVLVAIIMRAINVMLLLIGTFAFLVIFYSGVLLVTANGDEGRLEKGKNMIVPAILGLVFAFLSYYITIFVQSFFY